MIETKFRPYRNKKDSPILGDLLQTMFVVGPATEARSMFISRGGLADFIRRTQEAEMTAKPIPDGHLPDRHAAFLREQLNAGACLLWVTIRTADQKKRSRLDRDK